MSTQDKTKHTPLPWKADHHFSCHSLILGPHENYLLQTKCNHSDSEENRANAELVANAVNSHSQLVEALKAAQGALNTYGIDTSRSTEMSISCRICLAYSQFEPPYCVVLKHKPTCLFEQINAALKAAEEQK